MECDEQLPSPEEEALAALKASPLVKKIGLNTSARQGVYAVLWCACEHPSRRSEQLNVTQTRTTIARCAEELLELINSKHGGHLPAAEAARAQAQAEAAAVAGPSAPTTAFAAMGAAQHVQPAADRARTAEQAASKALEAKRAAEKALNEAAQAAAAAEVEAARLQAEADDARQAAGLQRKKARVEEADADAEPTSRFALYMVATAHGKPWEVGYAAWPQPCIAVCTPGGAAGPCPSGTSWRQRSSSGAARLSTARGQTSSRRSRRATRTAAGGAIGGAASRAHSSVGRAARWESSSTCWLLLRFISRYKSRHAGCQLSPPRRLLEAPSRLSPHAPQLIRHLGGRAAMTTAEVKKAETEAHICDLLEVCSFHLLEY